jgi:outer membrane PBP1 activator LpoA protein
VTWPLENLSDLSHLFLVQAEYTALAPEREAAAQAAQAAAAAEEKPQVVHEENEWGISVEGGDEEEEKQGGSSSVQKQGEKTGLHSSDFLVCTCLRKGFVSFFCRICSSNRF